MSCRHELNEEQMEDIKLLNRKVPVLVRGIQSAGLASFEPRQRLLNQYPAHEPITVMHINTVDDPGDQLKSLSVGSPRPSEISRRSTAPAPIHHNVFAGQQDSSNIFTRFLGHAGTLSYEATEASEGMQRSPGISFPPEVGQAQQNHEEVLVPPDDPEVPDDPPSNAEFSPSMLQPMTIAPKVATDQQDESESLHGKENSSQRLPQSHITQHAPRSLQSMTAAGQSQNLLAARLNTSGHLDGPKDVIGDHPGGDDCKAAGSSIRRRSVSSTSDPLHEPPPPPATREIFKGDRKSPGPPPTPRARGVPPGEESRGGLPPILKHQSNLKHRIRTEHYDKHQLSNVGNVSKPVQRRGPPASTSRPVSIEHRDQDRKDPRQVLSDNEIFSPASPISANDENIIELQNLRAQPRRRESHSSHSSSIDTHSFYEGWLLEPETGLRDVPALTVFCCSRSPIHLEADESPMWSIHPFSRDSRLLKTHLIKDTPKSTTRNKPPNNKSKGFATSIPDADIIMALSPGARREINELLKDRNRQTTRRYGWKLAAIANYPYPSSKSKRSLLHPETAKTERYLVVLKGGPKLPAGSEEAVQPILIGTEENLPDRYSNPWAQLDDSEFKHGAALDFPVILGEERRNSALLQIRERYNDSLTVVKKAGYRQHAKAQSRSFVDPRDDYELERAPRELEGYKRAHTREDYDLERSVGRLEADKLQGVRSREEYELEHARKELEQYKIHSTKEDYELEKAKKELEAYKLEKEREAEEKRIKKEMELKKLAEEKREGEGKAHPEMESEKAFERYKQEQDEKAAKEWREKEERDKGYQHRLEDDLRKSGMDRRQIAVVLKKDKGVDLSRPTYTRMSRKYVSIETLNTYRIDYERDQVRPILGYLQVRANRDFQDPDYILIKRWVPEYEQDFLWAHTKQIRELKERELRERELKERALKEKEEEEHRWRLDKDLRQSAGPVPPSTAHLPAISTKWETAPDRKGPRQIRKQPTRFAGYRDNTWNPAFQLGEWRSGTPAVVGKPQTRMDVGDEGELGEKGDGEVLSDEEAKRLMAEFLRGFSADELDLRAMEGIGGQKVDEEDGMIE
jgi:hypothetical protein